MHADDGDEAVHHGSRRLGGQPATLERGSQRVAEGGDPAAGIEPDGDIAGQHPVELHGDLQPAAGHRVDHRGHRGHEPLRRGQGVRRAPALVPGDVRIRPVGRERRRVGGRERAQQQARRAERQERVHGGTLGCSVRRRRRSLLRSASRLAGLRSCG
jgi:hypothetical protein